MNKAYFMNGELYDVFPQNNPNNLYEDREIAYHADIIISDGKVYNLSNAVDVAKIEIPVFETEIPSVLDMSYIMKIRCRSVDDVSIIPVFIQKTIDLMMKSNLIWCERDYMQVIDNYHRLGLIYECEKYKNDFLKRYGNIDENLRSGFQEAALSIGNELGHDAVQITAHGLCSVDHEPIQGRVFLKSEFEKMQHGKPFQDIDGNLYEPLARPIGTEGCMHFATSFSTQHSIPFFTDKQLSDFYALNHTVYIIEGKEYERHEVPAIMRDIASEIRHEKEIAVEAMKRGDMETRIQCQEHLALLSRKYHSFANTAGITPKLRELIVPGFKTVKLHK